MKKSKGMITVEAVILIPFLIVTSIVLIYFCAYVYDRSLMVQDVNVLAISARDYRMYGDPIERVCEKEYTKIKEEHPYIATDNIELSVRTVGTGVTIGLSGDWQLPIAPSLSKTIEYERTINDISPITIMFITEKVRETFTEEIDADSDGV